MHESSAAQLMQLNLVVRYVPRQYLLSIVKSYIQSADELNQKKRHAVSCSRFYRVFTSNYVELHTKTVQLDIT